MFVFELTNDDVDDDDDDSDLMCRERNELDTDLVW